MSENIEIVFLDRGDEEAHEFELCHMEETDGAPFEGGGERHYMASLDGYGDAVEGVPVAILHEGERRPIKTIFDIDHMYRQVDTDFVWTMFLSVVTLRPDWEKWTWVT